jgi:hypothetical protein
MPLFRKPSTWVDLHTGRSQIIGLLRRARVFIVWRITAIGGALLLFDIDARRWKEAVRRGCVVLVDYHDLLPVHFGVSGICSWYIGVMCVAEKYEAVQVEWLLGYFIDDSDPISLSQVQLIKNNVFGCDVLAAHHEEYHVGDEREDGNIQRSMRDM